MKTLSRCGPNQRQKNIGPCLVRLTIVRIFLVALEPDKVGLHRSPRLLNLVAEGHGKRQPKLEQRIEALTCHFSRSDLNTAWGMLAASGRFIVNANVLY